MFKNIVFKSFKILVFFTFLNVFGIEISELDTLELRTDFFHFLQACPLANPQTMDGDLIGRYLEPQFCQYRPNYSCLFSYLLSKELSGLSSECSISEKNKCFRNSISKATWIESRLRSFIDCVNDKIYQAMSFARLYNNEAQLEQIIDRYLDEFCSNFDAKINFTGFSPDIFKVFRVLNTPRHHCDFFCHIWISSTSIYRLLKYFDQSVKTGFLNPFQQNVLDYFFQVLGFSQNSFFAEYDNFWIFNTMLFFTYNWKIRSFERLTDIYFARSNPSSPKKERDEFVSCQSEVICPLKLIYCLDLAKMFNRTTLEFADSADTLIEKMLVGSNCGREELATYKMEFLSKLTAYLRAKIKDLKTSVEDYFISCPIELSEPKVLRPKIEEVEDVTKSPSKRSPFTPLTPSPRINSSPLSSKRAKKLDFGDGQAASSPKSAS